MPRSAREARGRNDAPRAVHLRQVAASYRARRYGREVAVETVVVTGAAGRIGSCLRAGWRSRFRLLRLVDHRDLGAAAAAEEVVQLDLCDFGGVEEAMRGVEVVVHLAAIPSEDEFERLLEAN